MPAYMTLPANTQRGDGTKRKIGPDQWPRVLQAIGTYLLYAREKYQAEPDYFSFNEPDIGIDILFNAEEHRDAIKRLGEHFAMLGLKTKLIAGDTGNARGTHKYVLPTVQDPEALKYVGAIAFHSWNGASPQQYAAWAEVADAVKLPLICNEAGVDPFAYQGGKYHTFAYGMREMVHYQELLLYAHPQAIVFWEFTGDYSLMSSERATTRDPVVTERLCLQKHWCNLTPPGSQALSATNDNDNILATAFRSPTGRDYTIHLANPKWPRPVTLEGLPASVTALKVTRTARDQLFQTLDSIPVKDGKAALVLPTESLTTLTTQ
jgi:O-glycosyl hydrolase